VLRAEVGGTPGLEIVDASVSIAKAADPARAVRNTPEASIVQAARSVAAGDADALVSGGSTGAALAAGLFDIKRARGIHRPALAAAVPVPGHPVTFLDVGANADVRPEHLVQFAYMGAALASVVLGVAEPRVALLSNGEEPSRGSLTVQEAHARLAAAPGLRFIGNIEGTQITAGAADVVVADGFTGNVALKVMEAPRSSSWTPSATPPRPRCAPGPAGCCCARPCGLPRRDRPGALGRRLPPRPAPPRRGPARPLRPGRLRERHRARRARRLGGRRRPHPCRARGRGRPAAGPGTRVGDADGQPSGASSSVPAA
jgi:hypothetical protein